MQMLPVQMRYTLKLVLLMSEVLGLRLAHMGRQSLYFSFVF